MSQSRQCALCRGPFACPGDTGGTSDTTLQEREEMRLWDSLARSSRGHCAHVRLRMHRVGAHCSPAHAQSLAVACAQLYPSGVIVLHLGTQGCCLFTASGMPQALHLGCAVEILRLRLGVGIVVGREGDAFALQVGKRAPPLMKLLRL